MGESACLMQPFSYASGIPNEAKEVLLKNPKKLLCYRETPYMLLGSQYPLGGSCQNPWLGRNGQPFPTTAMSKRLRGTLGPDQSRRRKAALLEQANATSNDIPKVECEGIVEKIATHEQQTMIPDSQVAVNEQQKVRASNCEVGFTVDANGHDLKVEMDSLAGSKVEESDPVTKHQVHIENSSKVELPCQLGNVDSHKEIAKMEQSGTTEMEKPLLQQSCDSNQDVLASMSKKKPAISSSKSSIHSRASNLPSSPAKLTASILPKKETNASPTSKKFVNDSLDKNKSTPKSNHKSIYFSPARELNKFTSTVMRKIESSRLGANSSKATKDCSTPLKTPTMASLNGVAKHPLATPQSENRRAKTPLDYSASESKTGVPKWCFLSTDANRNKPQSPVLSSPFSLRTDERAARRKQKLEEKFNANEAQKVKLQTILKEKAEMELKKLRHGLCFKARPLPDFYKERGAPKNQIKKVPSTHPQSPKIGRKLIPSIVQGKTTSLPPQKPSDKNRCSKHILEKNSKTPTRSPTSQSITITRENISPNIQYG